MNVVQRGAGGPEPRREHMHGEKCIMYSLLLTVTKRNEKRKKTAFCFWQNDYHSSLQGPSPISHIPNYILQPNNLRTKLRDKRRAGMYGRISLPPPHLHPPFALGLGLGLGLDPESASVRTRTGSSGGSLFLQRTDDTYISGEWGVGCQ